MYLNPKCPARTCYFKAWASPHEKNTVIRATDLYWTNLDYTQTSPICLSVTSSLPLHPLSPTSVPRSSLAFTPSLGLLASLTFSTNLLTTLFPESCFVSALPTQLIHAESCYQSSAEFKLKTSLSNCTVTIPVS